MNKCKGKDCDFHYSCNNCSRISKYTLSELKNIFGEYRIVVERLNETNREFLRNKLQYDCVGRFTPVMLENIYCFVYLYGTLQTTPKLFLCDTRYESVNDFTNFYAVPILPYK